MPKIFEYLGYFLFIYTDDHPPVHIHVQHGEYRAKAELLYEDGVLSLVFKRIRGFTMLPKKQQTEIGEFIEQYQTEIVDKWTQIHVYRQTVKSEKITRKV